MPEADRFGGAIEAPQGTDRFGGVIEAAPTEGQGAVQAVGGFYEGLAETLGLPVDIVSSALDLGGPEPFMGSKSLKKMFSKVGMEVPALPGYEAERRVGEELGAALPFAGAPAAIARGAAAVAPQAVTTAQRVGRQIIEPFVKRPARTAIGEGVAATGAGLGAVAAQRIAPGDVGAEVTGQIVGGVAPSAIAFTPTAIAAKTARAIGRKVSPEATAAQLRGALGKEITGEVGERIAAGQKVGADVPGLKPSLAELTGSPSLIRTQQMREARLSGAKLEQAVTRHQQNVDAINEFAASKSPTGEMDIDMVVDRVGGKVNSLIEDVEAKAIPGEITPPRISEKEIGARMRENLIKRRQESSAAMTEMANDLGLNDVDITPQYTTIREDLIETMTPTGRFAGEGNTPDAVKTLIADRGVNVPTSVEDLKSLREAMSDEYRGLVAGSAPDLRKARQLQMGLKQLDGALEKLDLPGDLAGKYQDFRRAYFENVINRFNRGAAFKVRQKGARNFYVTDDERVAKTFWGPKKDTDMAQYVEIFGDSVDDMDSMRSVILDDFYKATVRDGDVKPKLMDRWLDRFSGPLRVMPEVRNELMDVVSAQKAVQNRMGDLDIRKRKIEDSILTKKIKSYSRGTQTAEQVVSDAVKKPKLMKQLVGRIRNDEDALNSLRRHVWDDIVSGDSDAMRAAIDANKPSLRVLFAPKHLKNLDTIFSVKEMAGRVPPPTGREIGIQPLEALERETGMGLPQMASRVYAMQSGRIGARYMVTEMLGRVFRSQSIGEVDRMLDEALYDPAVAKLLANAIDFPRYVPVKNRLKKHWLNLGLTARTEALTEEERAP